MTITITEVIARAYPSQNTKQLNVQAAETLHNAGILAFIG
jgi:hypothetical protein